MVSLSSTVCPLCLLSAALLLLPATGALGLQQTDEATAGRTVEDAEVESSVSVPAETALPTRIETIGDHFKTEGSTSSSDADASDAELNAGASALPDDAGTRALVERVEQRWQYKIKREFDKVYEFETPEYRTHINVDAFAKNFGGFTQWHGIEVTKVEQGDDGHAVVDLLLDLTMASPLDDASLRSKVSLREHWVVVDEAWYHDTTPKSPLDPAARSAAAPTSDAPAQAAQH